MDKLSFKNIVLAGAGIASAAAVLYYLLREESAAESTAKTTQSSAKKSSEITKDDTVAILKEIIASQGKMKEVMKTITSDIKEKSLDFDQVYERVLAQQPPEPLEKFALSMGEFDRVLEKFQYDPDVRDYIATIMGFPGMNTQGTSSSNIVPASKLIDVHKFMLSELQAVADNNKDKFKSMDPKTVTMAAQALVGAKVEKEFNLTSDDIEAAVLSSHSELATNQEFAQINIKMQEVMTCMMGDSNLM